MDIATVSAPTILPRKPIQDWNHCYWLGGKRLYSASRVIRDLGMKPDYKDAKPEVIHRAACRGKLTEGYCYTLLQMKRGIVVRAKHTGTLQQEVSMRVEAFNRWSEKYRPEFIDCQQIAYSERDRVAWRRDLRVVIQGELWLVDIKCTSKPEKDWPLQLGCGLSYDEDKCKRAAVLHLNPKLKDGYMWRDKWSGAQLKDWWRRAVGRWHSNFDFMMLKNELGFDTEAMGLETEGDDE